MVMTLFGIKIFSACHSADSECHLHLRKLTESTFEFMLAVKAVCPAC